MSSFESNENIHKKEDGSYYEVSDQFTYIAKLLVLATPVSVCSYNGVVENDDLLSLFTANRKLSMATDIRSEISDCHLYQWQPLAASGINGKIANDTIGKTSNARNVAACCLRRFNSSKFLRCHQREMDKEAEN